MTQHSWYKNPWLILVAVFLLQWLLLFSTRAPAWDAVFYYVYGRSAIFDFDLELANDYRLSYPTSGEQFASKQFDQIETDTGRAANLFAIGSSILWLPWLTAIHLASELFYPGQMFSGFEPIFVSNLAFLSAVFVFIALALSYILVRELTNSKTGLIAAVTLSFTTPLIYYQFREPLYAHAASAFTVALCVFVWWKTHDRIGSVYSGLGLGGLIGLTGLVRWPNLAFLLLPLASTAMILLKAQPEKERKRNLVSAVKYLLAVAVAAIAVFSLQLSVWKVLFGSFVTIPQGQSFMDWRAPFLVPFLFSSFRGLIPWMPVFIPTLAGLVVLAKQKTQLGLPLLLMMLLVLFINGSTRDWFAGGAFGPRRLSGTLIILIIGYGVFLQFLPQRLRMWFAGIVGALLVMHQWILLRFGIGQRLGGHVLSMGPEFLWADVPIKNFAADILGLVPEIWQRPGNFFVFSGSPLDFIINRQMWPAEHLTAMLQTTFFLLVIIAAGTFLVKRQWFRKHPITLVILVGALITIANIWVLVGS